MPKPIALDAYEELAQAYSDIAEGKAENGLNEHPAIRSQIGDVAGLRVLDAGCGPGFMLRYLMDNSASKVVGFDVSPSMIELAEARTEGKAIIHLADMQQPLDFLEDQAFDLITSSLAIDYVEDWAPLLAEFRRVLVPSGRFVFSVQHPMAAYQWYQPASAFGVQLVETSWNDFTEKPVIVPDFYRPLEDVINPLLQAGFSLRGIVETKPIEALKAIDPDKYERHSKFPTFMVLDTQVA